MTYDQLETLGDENDDRLCFFDSVPKGLERYDFRLRHGEPVKDVYPDDAKLYMERHYRGVRLCSFLGNTKGMILASSELRQAIEKHCPGAPIEFLPFTLIDHRKRPYSTDYCIVNPLGSFDAADEKASEIERNDRGKILHIARLVLDGEKVAQASQLFRLDIDSSIYVVGPALGEEIRARKLTNVLLEPLQVTGG
jgi:hypothetical protein